MHRCCSQSSYSHWIGSKAPQHCSVSLPASRRLQESNDQQWKVSRSHCRSLFIARHHISIQSVLGTGCGCKNLLFVKINVSLLWSHSNWDTAHVGRSHACNSSIRHNGNLQPHSQSFGERCSTSWMKATPPWWHNRAGQWEQVGSIIPSHEMVDWSTSNTAITRKECNNCIQTMCAQC